MISLMFLLGILALLFVLGFVTRRRFGVLGLALAAGALLSANWAGTLTPFIEQQGLVLVAPPLAVVVEVALIILPPLALLFSGPAYQGTWPRLLGAAGFAVLAFTFTASAMSGIIRVEEPGLSLLTFINKYDSIIIVAGMIAAIVDVLLTGHQKAKAKH